MIKQIILSLLVISLIVSFITMAGCTSNADQEFIDFAESAAEEYLVSTDERDFATFSKHLSKEMEEALFNFC